jgi:hypothetical protein
MGEMVIPPDEVVEIVGAHQASENWKMQVEDANVLLDHNPNSVAQVGDRVKAGDRVILEDLRGDPVYAVAEGNRPATAYVSRAALSISFQTRDTVGAVQRDDGSAVAPASDSYEWVYGRSVDPSAGDIVESFEAPDRADWIVIGADDADNSFELEVQFQDENGNEILTVDNNNPDASLAGDSSTDVGEAVRVFGPWVQITLSGSATAVDFTVYAR